MGREKLVKIINSLPLGYMLPDRIKRVEHKIKTNKIELRQREKQLVLKPKNFLVKMEEIREKL